MCIFWTSSSKYMIELTSFKALGIPQIPNDLLYGNFSLYCSDLEPKSPYLSYQYNSKEKSHPRWFCAILIEVIWHCTERRSYCPYHLFLFFIPVMYWCSLQGFVPKDVYWNISRVLTFIPRYLCVLRNTSSALGQEEYNSIGSRGIKRGI